MIADDQNQEHPTEEMIDETLKESFPASDPPGWTLGIEPLDPFEEMEEEDGQQADGDPGK